MEVWRTDICQWKFHPLVFFLLIEWAFTIKGRLSVCPAFCSPLFSLNVWLGYGGNKAIRGRLLQKLSLNFQIHPLCWRCRVEFLSWTSELIMCLYVHMKMPNTVLCLDVFHSLQDWSVRYTCRFLTVLLLYGSSCLFKMTMNPSLQKSERTSHTADWNLYFQHSVLLVASFGPLFWKINERMESWNKNICWPYSVTF